MTGIRLMVMVVRICVRLSWGICVLVSRRRCAKNAEMASRKEPKNAMTVEPWMVMAARHSARARMDMNARAQENRVSALVVEMGNFNVMNNATTGTSTNSTVATKTATSSLDSLATGNLQCANGVATAELKGQKTATMGTRSMVTGALEKYQPSS